jgi:hypothetical protein
MTTQMLYGYVEDTVFQPKVAIDLANTVNTGLGYLDDNLVNYFAEKSILNDVRSTRLNLLGQPLTGILRLLFDKSKLEDLTVIEQLSSVNQAKIFNILERIVYSNNELITNVINQLETEAQYDIYVEDSLSWSSDLSHVTIIVNSAPVDLVVRSSFTFAVNINGSIINFKIWIKSSVFKEEYPLSTITQIIPAAPPEYFLDISKFTDIISAIITTSNFKFTRMHPEIKEDDHSGLVEYYTKFVISSSSIRNIPFGVLYKGAKPSTLEIRQAIREYLIDLGIAQEENWTSIFPDLFVVAEFYLIPIWTNKINRLEREVYPSILSLNNPTEAIPIIFPNLSTEYINTRTELVMNSKTEVFTISVPDINNDPQFESLWMIHPTYQNHGPDHSTFGFMEEHTQEFGRRFAKAISILVGETFITDEFADSTINDHRYLSFTVNRVEYHVLYESSYPH